MSYYLMRNGLHFLLSSRIELKTIKQVFKFYKKKNPSLFLQKDKAGNSLLEYLMKSLKSSYTKDIIKYILKFFVIHFPFFVFKKNQY